VYWKKLKKLVKMDRDEYERRLWLMQSLWLIVIIILVLIFVPGLLGQLINYLGSLSTDDQNIIRGFIIGFGTAIMFLWILRGTKK